MNCTELLDLYGFPFEDPERLLLRLLEAEEPEVPTSLICCGVKMKTGSNVALCSRQNLTASISVLLSCSLKSLWNMYKTTD